VNASEPEYGLPPPAEIDAGGSFGHTWQVNTMVKVMKRVLNEEGFIRSAINIRTRIRAKARTSDKTHWTETRQVAMCIESFRQKNEKKLRVGKGQ
jgi:hypothetical protein